MSSSSLNELKNQMFLRFGPTIGSKDLYAALGFKTYAAFHRSQQLGVLGISVFKLPGRRDWFALTDDVAKWLDHQSQKNN